MFSLNTLALDFCLELPLVSRVQLVQLHENCPEYKSVKDRFFLRGGDVLKEATIERVERYVRHSDSRIYNGFKPTDPIPTNPAMLPSDSHVIDAR